MDHAQAFVQMFTQVVEESVQSRLTVERDFMRSVLKEELARLLHEDLIDVALSQKARQQPKASGSTRLANASRHTEKEVRQLIKANTGILVQRIGPAPFTFKMLAHKLREFTELREGDLIKSDRGNILFDLTVQQACRFREWPSRPFTSIPPQHSGSYIFKPELIKRYAEVQSLKVLDHPPLACLHSTEFQGHHSSEALKQLIIELSGFFGKLYGSDEIAIAAIIYIASLNTKLTDADKAPESSGKEITQFHKRLGQTIAEKTWKQNPFCAVGYRRGVYKLKAPKINLRSIVQGPNTNELRHTHMSTNSKRHSPNDIRKLIVNNMKYIVKELGRESFYISDFIALISLYADLTVEDRKLVEGRTQTRFYKTAYDSLRRKGWAANPLERVSHGQYKLHESWTGSYTTHNMHK